MLEAAGRPGNCPATTGLNWANYEIEASLTYESFLGSAKEAQLLFRWQDPNNFYMARIINRGSWVVEFGMMVGGQWSERLQRPISNFNPFGNNRFKVNVNGSDFTFYVNDEWIEHDADSRLTRGTVGLGANEAIVRFHDLTVVFPGEDLRDPATHEIDRRIRSLREVVAQVADSLAQIGSVPATFEPADYHPAFVEVVGESNDPDVRAAVQAVQGAASDLSLPVVTESGPDGDLRTSIALDGSTTFYDEEGRPGLQFDRQGRLEMTYEYQEDQLAKMTYVKARKDLAGRISAMRADVRSRATRALELLAEVPGHPEAVIIGPDLRLHATPGTRDRLVMRVPIEDGRIPGEPTFRRWR